MGSSQQINVYFSLEQPVTATVQFSQTEYSTREGGIIRFLLELSQVLPDEASVEVTTIDNTATGNQIIIYIVHGTAAIMSRSPHEPAKVISLHRAGTLITPRNLSLLKLSLYKALKSHTHCSSTVPPNMPSILLQGYISSSMQWKNNVCETSKPYTVMNTHNLSREKLRGVMRVPALCKLMTLTVHEVACSYSI